jgi:hypothetical protein
MGNVKHHSAATHHHGRTTDYVYRQPGTLLTQWETVREKGVTMLGLLSLLATFNALLYTTSSGALGAMKGRSSKISCLLISQSSPK